VKQKRISEMSMRSFSDSSSHLKSFQNKSDTCLSAFPVVEPPKTVTVSASSWDRQRRRQLAKQIPDGITLTRSGGVVRMEFQEGLYKDSEEFLNGLDWQEE
jgi:hypothetical protein